MMSRGSYNLPHLSNDSEASAILIMPSPSDREPELFSFCSCQFP
jgi:hypothetical protein